jgi:hypothetical protein
VNILDELDYADWRFVGKAPRQGAQSERATVANDLESILDELDYVDWRFVCKAPREGAQSNRSTVAYDFDLWHDDVGAEALASALTNNARLEYINLTSNKFGDEGEQDINSSLYRRTKTRLANGGSRGRGDEQQHLPTARFQFNNIGSTGATALGEAASMNNKTTTRIIW